MKKMTGTDTKPGTENLKLASLLFMIFMGDHFNLRRPSITSGEAAEKKRINLVSKQLDR
jgi:hypothetical protein